MLSLGCPSFTVSTVGDSTCSTACIAFESSTVERLYSRHLGTRRDCLYYEGVLILGVESALWQGMENHLVLVVCVCVNIKGVSAIQNWRDSAVNRT